MNKPLILIPKEPQPPRFKQGDRTSDLKVIDYLGYLPSHDDSLHKAHRYECLCMKCGAVRIVEQAYLVIRTEDEYRACKKCVQAKGQERRRATLKRKHGRDRTEPEGLTHKKVASMRW